MFTQLVPDSWRALIVHLRMYGLVFCRVRHAGHNFVTKLYVRMVAVSFEELEIVFKIENEMEVS